jgi:hypothetical protein
MTAAQETVDKSQTDIYETKKALSSQGKSTIRMGEFSIENWR